MESPKMSQLDSASLTWEIENFSNLTTSYISSSDVKTMQDTFWLRLYPKDYLKDMENYVAVYLFRGTPHTTDLKVLWTLSIINNDGMECYSRGLEANFTAQSSFYPIAGCSYHLNLNTILEPTSGLLSRGKLTVKCTFTILNNQNSFDSAKWFIDNKITFAKNRALENYQPHLDKSKYSDVVFVIGVKQFKLHKIILASQSPVFAAMFENDLEEAKQNRVDIIDVDVEVFEAMIRFIYTANVDSVQQYALELLVAADKYQLDSLKDICAQSLVSNLSIESVANILLVADIHNEAELKSKCIEFINNKNTTKVFATDGWKQLVKSRHELGLELYYDIANKLENK